MTASKTTTPKTNTKKSQNAHASAAEYETTAQAAMDRVKDAMPSLDDITNTVRDQTNVDLQNMADDAATFVRRNPAASIAAAAGIGVLIGILATKRS